MAVKEKFVLKWADFSSTVTASFQEIRKEAALFDLTLIVGKRQLKTHRFLLSACSPVFRTILRDISTHHPYIYLKGVRYEILLSILDFMYQGEVSVNHDDLTPFLDLAEELQVRGLTQDPSGGQDRTEDKSNIKPVPSRSVRGGQPSPAVERSVPAPPTGEGSRNQAGTTRSINTGDSPQKPDHNTPLGSVGKHRLIQEERRNKGDSEDEIKISKVVNPRKRRKTENPEPMYAQGLQSTMHSQGENAEVNSDEVDILEDHRTQEYRGTLPLDRDRDKETEETEDVKEEYLSDNSLGIKSEISITENLSHTVDMSAVGLLSEECRRDIASLQSISNKMSHTDEDTEVLATLNEALEDLTREFMLQVPDKSWKCRTCNQLFYAKLSCQTHIEADHLEPENRVCPVCIQKFPTIKAVREHVLSGHRKAGEPLDEEGTEGVRGNLHLPRGFQDSTDDMVDSEDEIPVINL